jgi:diaminohydroxyphosphoribosylaminopyrimidine deaminase / 5-amino-6-(5-phosphoribosylamino)uracil reductase
MMTREMDWSHFMKKALVAARKGYGNTGPNPLVGALVVRGGQVISTGYHRRVGEEHAEVAALRLAGSSARGADLVVTLEPCSHFGRTPPCVNRIAEAGIARVVVGTLDPNPQERGRGITMLKEAGTEVIIPVLEEQCRRLNEPYYKYITSGRPFVTLKLACSIDGRIATGTGDSNWFTGPETNRLIHRQRRDSHAILVGARTARLDNPRLSVRHARPCGYPLRVVASSDLNLPLDLVMFQPDDRQRTVVFTTTAAREGAVAELEQRAVEVVRTEPTKAGRVDLEVMLEHLGAMGVARLLVEGGGGMGAGLLEGHHVDRLLIAYAPVAVGHRGTPSLALEGNDRLVDARRWRTEWCRKSGDDVLVSIRVGPEYWRGEP